MRHEPKGNAQCEGDRVDYRQLKRSPQALKTVGMQEEGKKERNRKYITFTGANGFSGSIVDCSHEAALANYLLLPPIRVESSSFRLRSLSFAPRNVVTTDGRLVCATLVSSLLDGMTVLR